MTPIETLEAVYRDQVRLIMQTIFADMMVPKTPEQDANILNRFRCGLTTAALVRSILLKVLNEVEGNR